MSKFMRDPDLEQLVKELNGSELGVASVLATEAPAFVAHGAAVPAEAVDRWLVRMLQDGATDLHLVAGSAAVMRINGELRFVEDSPVSESLIRALVPATRTLTQELAARGSIDLALSASIDDDSRRGFRFRVNVHLQRGALAAAIRVLPTRIPTLAQLQLPSSLVELTKPSRGLVLVCGPTGCGKSTTMAALVDEINRRDARHIITIEDPLEYDHANRRALVEQIEIGKDAPSYAAALRSALRQDPDVILVGEIRDAETMSMALTAAETGHLILSTLHTTSPAQTIHRIVDMYPAAQQGQIYKQAALSLHAILNQKLVPRFDGRGVAPAVELLLMNHAVRNQIRNAKLEGLANEMVLGKRQGMITFDDSLRALASAGLISADEAMSRANDPDDLRRVM
ncbi:MAG: PilT/PilU family type 4a pilus ATPase [Acidobacteria bacterium]|nr:PilT/PilU family type 4a pilus ATPase [Acidobacteriota bacterium]